jgi:saccharopine dehydrogenase (NADP+, L-glutamate forming)/spermidine synthase
MKKVAIIGAGWMTKPLVDYLMETCGYFVTVANRTLSKAEDVVADRAGGTAVRWSTDEPEILDEVIRDADLAISMVPKPVHIHVARACLRHGTHMLTTAYEIPELVALDEEARQKGILILNELGEVPGMDHMGTQLVLDEVRQEGGRVIRLNSYGSGLPAFEFNRNPMGYKFSWDPRTVFVAAQTPGAYLEEGKRIEVPGDKLFENFWLVDIEGLGTFESYPNKDVEKYVEPFGLDGEKVSFYRGLLRFSGYCNNMRHMLALGLIDSERERSFEGMSHRQFMASLVGAGPTDDVESAVAQYLGLDRLADIIHRLKWLGLFEDLPIAVSKGTCLDVLLDRMLARMSYEPGERDMILLHVDVLAEFPGGRRERRLATMHVEGIPDGATAMSRAVALPAAVAARLVLEGEIRASGARMPPTLPELYRPVLEELATLGFEFKRCTVAA